MHGSYATFEEDALTDEIKIVILTRTRARQFPNEGDHLCKCIRCFSENFSISRTRHKMNLTKEVSFVGDSFCLLNFQIRKSNIKKNFEFVEKLYLSIC